MEVMNTAEDFVITNEDDDTEFRVSGNPINHGVQVTINGETFILSAQDALDAGLKMQVVATKLYKSGDA